jgi:hypothetical protein
VILSDDDAAELLAMIADESYVGATSFTPMALPDGSVNSGSFLPGLDSSNDDIEVVASVDRLSGMFIVRYVYRYSCSQS